MPSIGQIRSLTLATLFALVIALAATMPGASADGDEDDHAVILEELEKNELKYPNLGSALNDLVVRVEEGETTAEDAAEEAPMHREESAAVTVYLAGHVEEVVTFLEAHGGDPRNVGEDYIEAYVPVMLLGSLSEQPGVIRVWEIVPPQEEFGPITSQGVQAHGSAAWNQVGYNGQDIKVGIIDRFEGFRDLMGTELPSTVIARCYTDVARFTQNLADCDADSDHGTAVAEAIMDIAPEVSLYIANPPSLGDMQEAARWMTSQGVVVINRSASYPFQGPGDGTSPFSWSSLRTIDQTVANGSIWVNSAGNYAYRSTWFSDSPAIYTLDAVDFVAFDDSDDIKNGLAGLGTVSIQLRWDDRWGGASSDLDLLLWDTTREAFIARSEDYQTGQPSHIPSERLRHPLVEGRLYEIVVIHRSGTVPDWVQLVARGASEIEHYTEGHSINNPSESKNPGMLAVGAAPYYDMHTIEPYSSRGPTPDGRFKPDIVGADCGASAIYRERVRSSGDSCWFSGTSQAAPHVAGMAALVRQQFPNLDPEGVADYLKDHAERRGTVRNNTWGYGFAQLPAHDAVVPPAKFSTTQLETLFDEIISKTEQREAFSEVKETNISFSALEDMKQLRSEFVASKTETELYHALVKLSNARRDAHLRISPVDGGLQPPEQQACVSAPIHVLPDLSDIHNPTFFVAAVGEGLASPQQGDVIVGVNGRSVEEYIDEFTFWTRHSTLPGLYWVMADDLPQRVSRVPQSLYSERLDLTLERSSGERYDVSLPYSSGCPRFPLVSSNPGFVEVMRRENFNVLLDRSRQIIILQWLDFEYSLIQDIIDLMEYGEQEGILDYDMIIDVTESSGGSRGAYAIQRLVDRPFRPTFGNVRLSDLGKERIEREAGRDPRTDEPDIFGLNLSGSWLIDWARTDAMEAIRRGDEYTPPVPFKLAHLPKDSDGILQPAPVHFSGRVAIINGRTWGGSHLDQFVAMFVDNDLAVFVGVPTGGFSNTWEGDEVLHFSDTGQPVVEFMWSIGHTIRPNGEVLEGNPAQPDDYIPLTRHNFQDYHQTLLDTAIAALEDPEPTEQCVQTLTGDGPVSGEWAAGCESEEREGRYARYYSFTLAQDSSVTITLERTSGEADTYLNLWSGTNRTGAPLDSDDDTPDTSRSEITRDLPAGDYTIEATTYDEGETGSFTLRVSGLGAATTPPPGPEPTEQCVQTLTGDGPVSGEWAAGCESEEREGRYARYYSFTLAQDSSVTITLERTSGEADTYLNLWSGTNRTGAPLDSDDDTPDTSRSEITRDLPAGDYTIEATTYDEGETGSFTLRVSGLGAATTPPPGPEPTEQCVQTLTGDGPVSGEWAAGCESEEREGRYARYYSFTLAQDSSVTITLERTSGEADTYLNLWSGTNRTGAPLDSDDDTPDTSRSEITRDLPAGDYTIEATTYDEGETGSFTLRVSGLGAATTPPPGPDLVVEAPAVSNNTPPAGGSFTLSATVHNRGNGASDSTTLRYYRSSDSTITTGDSQIGTDSVFQLEASEKGNQSISLTAPDSPGTYYYGACVDAVSGESNMANNCSSAVVVTVGVVTAGDYDADNNGLIEVSNLTQLNAIRWDLDGDGESREPGYSQAFPGAVAGMGCPNGVCSGYELISDLDFDTNGNGQADAGDAYWNDGSGWEPIDLRTTFDGGGHTITNIYINRSDQDEVGLFGDPFVSGVIIRNVGLVSVDVTGKSSVGGLVGDAHGINITDSYVTGSVSGVGAVGGLIGDSFRSTITNSYSTASVSGSGSKVGGLVGDSHTDTLSNSYASGNVSGGDAIGGLVGDPFSGTAVGGLIGDSFRSTITNSYSTASVSGSGSKVGGLVGDSHTDTLSNSYASGNVSGGDAIGGLVGDSFSGTIVASFATGNVNGDDYIGGLIGDSHSTKIASGYATGDVVATGDEIGGLIGDTFETTIIASYAAGDVTGNASVGGLVGNLFQGSVTAGYATGLVSGNAGSGGLIGLRSLAPTINVSYWDSQTSGQSNSDGGIRKTTAELQSSTGYTGIFSTWNVDVDGDGSTDDPWDFGTSSQYPVLKYGGLSVAAQRNTFD